MAKISNPVRFSQAFGVPDETLENLGVFDPVLNVDTKLFIDPLLLENSAHAEMVQARSQFNKHFESIIKLLQLSKSDGDVAWRNAHKRLQFREITGTCLGYGAGSIHGSGFGVQLSDALISTAKEIIDLGIHDPDLFLVLALFEEGIGPDRISDMTTNVILKQLMEFNGRVIPSLDLSSKAETFSINQTAGPLIRNPLEKANSPIILLPRDILRDLPVANDFSEVSDAAAKNAVIRDTINSHIAELWRAKTRKEKDALRERVLHDKAAFEALLAALHATNPKGYNLDLDSRGLVVWHRFINETISGVPLDLSKYASKKLSLEDVYEVASTIVNHFQRLVEDNGLAKELWAAGKPRPEKSAQRIFFAVADSYCRANNIDVSPEADSGSGPVDFKFATGHSERVLVELKLSTNSKVVSGYTSQLEIYKKAEDTTRAIYVVIDVGSMGNKDVSIEKARQAQLASGVRASEIVFIDGFVKKSASKR